MNNEIALPKFALMVINEIARNKNSHIQYGDNEISINAPDPGEEGEQDVCDNLETLRYELEGCGFKCDVFRRGEKIDALRIYLKNRL